MPSEQTEGQNIVDLDVNEFRENITDQPVPDLKMLGKFPFYRFVDRIHIDVIRVPGPLAHGLDQLEKKLFYKLLHGESDIRSSGLKELPCGVDIVVFQEKRHIQVELFRRRVEYGFFFRVIHLLYLMGSDSSIFRQL